MNFINQMQKNSNKALMKNLIKMIAWIFQISKNIFKKTNCVKEIEKLSIKIMEIK